jgi:alkanesulfonate monooxygenase SsuD/methylene tetrahydromethanopterin reductase-like flavin-dependent oxidoreductase (luciferase family)
MRSVQFGLNVDPHVNGLPIAERITAIADTHGIDFVGIQDHPYIASFYDTFTLITWLASRTERVRFFPNVANLPLRPPAMLAKQTATIDHLTGGRLELGLGSGGFADKAAAMGAAPRSPAQARRELGEAIDVIRATWAANLPPAHDMGIWLGVVGPRSAALLGAKADGWSVSAPYVPPSKLDELNAIIDAAAREAGRDPAAVVRNYNIMGMLGPDDGWVEKLTSLYRDHGMNCFTFWPTRDRERQSLIFAREIAPAVRAALGQ